MDGRWGDIKCANCGFREAAPGSLWCPICEKKVWDWDKLIKKIAKDYKSFDEFYSEIEGMDDFTKFLKIDDVLYQYQLYRSDPNRFSPILGPNFEDEHRRAEGKLLSLASGIIKERVGDSKLLERFKELRKVVLDYFRKGYGCDDVHSVIVKAIKRQGVGIDSILALNRYFEPFSAVYIVELLAELAMLSNGLAVIEKLIEEIRRGVDRYALILTVKPWEHQEEALRAWIDRGKGIISMATGTGKTVVGLMAIRELRKSLKNVLVAAHSRAILNQWRREFIDKFALPIAHADYTEPIKLDGMTIKFRTIQSIIQSEGVIRTDLLIVDEVHHLAAPEFSKVVREKVEYRYFLGLSASPDEGYRREVFKELDLPVVYTFGLREAIDKGVLPRFKWIVCKVLLSPRETREFVEISEQIKRKIPAILNSQEFQEFAEKLGEKNIESLWDLLKLVEKARYKGIEIPTDLSNLMVLVLKRRWIVHRSLPKIEEVVKLAEQYYHEGKKVIIFAMDIKSCETVRDELIKRGVDRVFVVHSKIKRPFDVISEFRESRKGILIGAKMLDEGIDIPDAEIGINLASSKTRLQLIQRIGRILRKYGDKKPIFYHFIGVPHPYYFIEHEDPFAIYDEVAWVADTALSMGLEIKIKEHKEIAESIEKAYRKISSIRSTFNVPSGTIRIDELASQFNYDLINYLEEIDREISYSEFVKIVKKHVNNAKGLWWLYVLGNRNPKKIAEILKSFGP